MKLFIHSFKNALRGIHGLLHERNAKIHAVFAIGALVLSFLFQISTLEWIFVVLAIVIVFFAEAFNSALERLADRYTQHHDEEVRMVKDIAAGGVLFASIAAILIGAFVFMPYIHELLF